MRKLPLCVSTAGAAAAEGGNVAKKNPQCEGRTVDKKEKKVLADCIVKS